MKQKEVPEMDDVAEIISKISEDSPYKRRSNAKENLDDRARKMGKADWD